MKTKKRNYVAFIAGMATMVLLACLISASLAKEDAPTAHPRSADPQIARGEAGIALFGVEYAAPGETLKTRQGAEVPLVLTYTDDKGKVHYYVEAQTIADILDVSMGAEYNETLNCVDFGSQYLRDEDGELLLRENEDGTKEKILWTSEPSHDFDINEIMINGKSVWVAADTVVTSGNDSAVVSSTGKTPEELEQEAALWAERIKETPLKPQYGASAGMYTEVDPAEMDTASWSGTAVKGQLFESSSGSLERTFAFTPYLGAYAAITLENIGKTDVQFTVTRPYTVGRYSDELGGAVRVPAGGKLTRAFRIDENLPLENQLNVNVRAMAASGTPVQVKLTAAQYRFGK